MHSWYYTIAITIGFAVFTAMIAELENILSVQSSIGVNGSDVIYCDTHVIHKVCSLCNCVVSFVLLIEYHERSYPSTIQNTNQIHHILTGQTNIWANHDQYNVADK